MRGIHRLKTTDPAKANKKGYLADGGGLYLQVSASGAKSWVFRYREGGRLREMGLGSLNTISLTEARQKALEARKLRLEGQDPIGLRAESRATLRASHLTFKACAEQYMAAHKAEWKHPAHREQWEQSLRAYVFPVIGDCRIGEVTLPLILEILEPIWGEKSVTASRVRNRIELVLDWATVRGHRKGENPARWKGHLEHLLPHPSKIAKVTHLAALPYEELPSFLSTLREQSALSAKALEFAILTATRTSEVLEARWGEIEGRVWTIPAERMKAGKEHRVPLSEAALRVLKGLKNDGHYLFSGLRNDRPLTKTVLLQLLRRMGRGDLTTHGFRSTFRQWVAEQTSYPREVAEQALAHSLKSAVEAAYQRGDLFEKRRKLMEEWGEYADG